MESEISSRSETQVFTPKNRAELKAAVDDYILEGGRSNEPIGTWDVSRVTDMTRLFHGHEEFNEDISNWDTSSVTDMSEMFGGAEAFNQPLNNWDVSNVINMHGMFNGATFFNQNISNWNTSRVKDMSEMFEATEYFNQPLNTHTVTRPDGTKYTAWDVSNVTNMANMFNTSLSFNQPLNNWDMSSVTNVSGMFNSADSFNQDKPKLPKIKLTDCGNYENNESTTLMGIPFENLNKTREECEVEGIDPDECGINRIVKLPDGNCEDIFTFRDRAESGDRNVGQNPYTMVEIDQSTKKQIIKQLKLEGITHLEMSNGSTKPVEKLFAIDFLDAIKGAIDDVATTGYFVDRVIMKVIAERGQGVYNSQNKLIGIVNDWDQENRSLLDINNKVILRLPEDISLFEDDDSDGETIFKIYGIPDEEIIEIRNLTESELEEYHKKMREQDILIARSYRMDPDPTPRFSPVDRRELKSAVDAYIGGDHSNEPIGTWDTSRVTDMNGLFENHEEFNEDIGDWDVSNVTDMSGMFYNARSFNQDISNWDTSCVTTMVSMFREAYKFNQPINTHIVRRSDGSRYEAWDVSGVTSMNYMFSDTRAFNQSLNNWDTSRVTDMGGMFRGAKAFDQDISNWDVNSDTFMEYMFQGATTMLRKLPHLKSRDPVGTPDVNDWKADMTPRDKLFLDYKKAKNKQNLLRNFVESKKSIGVLQTPLQSALQHPSIQDALGKHIDKSRGYIFQN
jgi:surface protein